MLIQLTCGTDLDKDQHPIRDIDRKLSGIETLASELFGSVTTYRGVGSWLHPEHKILVHENCVTFVVAIRRATRNNGNVSRFAEFARDTLNQHSVLLTTIESSETFV